MCRGEHAGHAADAEQLIEAPFVLDDGSDARLRAPSSDFDVHGQHARARRASGARKATHRLAWMAHHSPCRQKALLCAPRAPCAFASKARVQWDASQE